MLVFGGATASRAPVSSVLESTFQPTRYAAEGAQRARSFAAPMHQPPHNRTYSVLASGDVERAAARRPLEMLARTAFRRAVLSHRRMSTTPGKQTFIIIGHDPTDAGALARRLAVREEHLVRLRKLVAEGAIRIGGVMLSPASIEPGAETKEFVGSVLIVYADTLADARRIAEEDVYYRTGVWDKEKLTVLPFLPSFGMQP